MRTRAILAITAAMILLSIPASAAGISNLGIYTNTRFESHNISGTKLSDDLITQTVTFVKGTGYRSAVMGSFGARLNIDDKNIDNDILSLSYLHKITKSSYVMGSFANYQAYENPDNGILTEDTDSFFFMHSWKVIKRNWIQGFAKTAFVTDKDFSDNRMTSETFSLMGPCFKKVTWKFSYQFGYTLVDDRQTINAWDAGFSIPVMRNGRFGVGFRHLIYLNDGSTNNDDNTWLMSYSHKIK